MVLREEENFQTVVWKQNGIFVKKTKNSHGQGCKMTNSKESRRILTTSSLPHANVHMVKGTKLEIRFGCDG